MDNVLVRRGGRKGLFLARRSTPKSSKQPPENRRDRAVMRLVGHLRFRRCSGLPCRDSFAFLPTDLSRSLAENVCDQSYNHWRRYRGTLVCSRRSLELLQGEETRGDDMGRLEGRGRIISRSSVDRVSLKRNQRTYSTNHTAISFNIRRWPPHRAVLRHSCES